MRNDSFLY